MDSGPLMSCLGAVFWSLLLPNAGSWLTISNWLCFKSSQSHIVVDGQTVSQSVLASSPIWSSWPDIYYCLTVTVLYFVGLPLWREGGSIFYICCWLLPAQSFSGPSPLVLATIFYCLRFETSHFVDSDSVYVWMLLKSGPCIRNRRHLVARFTFPVLALPWIPTIWLRRRRVFIFR
jgi:hypothetical protein